MADAYETVSSGRPFLGDGAIGTMLQEAGLTDGGAPELWNVEHPDRVARVHEAYAAAGARALTTNTFGGTRARLALHGLQERAVQLSATGARLAREVADRHGCLVAGSMGPTGELLSPLGTMEAAEASQQFAEQARGLAEGGADLVLVETMADLGEAVAAVEGARTGAPGLEVAVTMTFDTKGRTMMGVTPARAVTELAAAGVRLVGANCGNGPDEARVAMTEMAEARPDGVLLIIQSNAGLPKLVGADFRYDGTPEVMAAFAAEMAALGIDWIGACCGSTPAHITAMGDAIAAVSAS